jgi:tripartite-type tricarboxylate transporter receptor subunit TctC
MIRFNCVRRRILKSAVVAGVAGLALPSAVRARDFPDRPVRIVLPQPPGGAADRLARILAGRLEARWKQPVLVENRPGGGVIVGTSATVRSAPDGYTIGLFGSSLSINAVQRKDLPYDAIKDLQPVARVGYYTVALVATNDFPANSVPELIELARRQPGKFSFGSNGIGTSAQLAGEMLNHMADIELLHVPYNGAAKMYTDIIGKQIPIGFGVASSADGFLKSGQIKVLGVTSKQRSPLYPDWPTIAETLPDFEAINWAGFAAPVGVPVHITQKLAGDILSVLAEPEVAKMVADMGIEVSPQGPEDFSAFIQSEIKRFAEITKPLGAPAN